LTNENPPSTALDCRHVAVYEYEVSYQDLGRLSRETQQLSPWQKMRGTKQNAR